MITQSIPRKFRDNLSNTGSQDSPLNSLGTRRRSSIRPAVAGDVTEVMAKRVARPPDARQQQSIAKISHSVLALRQSEPQVAAARIPARFQLTETVTSSYSVRTRWNIRASDGTAIFSGNPPLTGEMKLTRELALQLGKPMLHLCVTQGIVEAARQLRSFVESHGIVTLNVAGPRASGEPDTGLFVKCVFDRAFKQFIA